MSVFRATLRGTTHTFPDLRTLLAKATPARSGDELAGLAAANAVERVTAQHALADVPLTQFLTEPVVPYETDEVTRLILDTHDRTAFAPVADLTVGAFRDWLLRYETDAAMLTALASHSAGLDFRVGCLVFFLFGGGSLGKPSIIPFFELRPVGAHGGQKIAGQFFEQRDITPGDFHQGLVIIH